MSSWPHESKLSALHITRACEASFARLQTDYIDLHQMHYVDRATPWDEIWDAMETLRYAGKSSTPAGPNSPVGTSPKPSRWPSGVISSAS